MKFTKRSFGAFVKFPTYLKFLVLVSPHDPSVCARVLKVTLFFFFFKKFLFNTAILLKKKWLKLGKTF